MPSVTIDASVLAVPELESTAEDAHRYIDTILDWRRLLDEPWVAIYMSERASGVLFDTGLYPLRDQLIKLFNAHGIVEYDVHTVVIVVDNLLRRTPHFETYFKIHDVLFDNISTNPDILQFSSGTVLKSDLARCVVLIAILRDHCSKFCLTRFEEGFAFSGDSTSLFGPDHIWLDPVPCDAAHIRKSLGIDQRDQPMESVGLTLVRGC
ncbi:MAG: hypothetical protein L6406_17130 [Desulfobacterales bacterium]|nr:hypothetical protein [Desulfobacterales bacterium]